MIHAHAEREFVAHVLRRAFLRQPRIKQVIDRSDRGVFAAELDGDLDDTADQMALVVFPSSIQVNRLHDSLGDRVCVARLIGSRIPKTISIPSATARPDIGQDQASVRSGLFSMGGRRRTAISDEPCSDTNVRN
jgi:hypothetical protein